MYNIKSKTKNNKGITLVALIITIIVLLILAVVAIGAITNDGIISKAKQARDQYGTAQDKENSILQGYLDKINDNAGNGNSGNGSTGESNDSGDNQNGDIEEEESNTFIGNLGKYVRYDVDGDGVIENNEYESILWRVLRDDEEKVELITADALGNLDLSPTDSDDARNKYNNALELMVQECERVTGIAGVRNVGGPAIDMTSETVDFSELEEFVPNEGTDFSLYEGDNGFKVDNYYEEDYNQMKKIGLARADNSQIYWLASRNFDEVSHHVNFYVRCMYDEGEIGYQDICHVYCWYSIEMRLLYFSLFCPSSFNFRSWNIRWESRYGNKSTTNRNILRV